MRNLTYFGTRLSENISRREPEGYLICLNVPVARTGVQDYLPSELGLPGPDDRLIPVHRPESEVFAPACVASFEGMPVTDDHPAFSGGVTAENIRDLQKGHAHNLRRGTGKNADLLIADLIITSPSLAEEILAGKREISCGYNYVLCEENGQYIQREIRGNHVAVVDAGRAGPRVSIHDRKSAAARTAPDGRPDRSGPSRPAASGSRSPHPHITCFDERSERNMKKNNLWPARLMTRLAKDGDTEGLSELISEILETPAEAEAEADVPETAETPEEAPVVVETPVEQPVLIDCGAEILEALRQIISLLSAPGGDCDPEENRDEEPEETAEAAAEIAENGAENLAEAALEAAAETLEALSIDPAAGDEDPVEELVAEILETEAEEEPASDDDPLDIVSSILEPETGSDEDGDGDEGGEDPAVNAQAADALRAALAGFRPQLARMSPKERQRFNADVAARMKKLTRRAGSSKGRPNAYAALRRAAAHDRSDRSLGKKIMASRNVNLAKRK